MWGSRRHRFPSCPPILMRCCRITSLFRHPIFDNIFELFDVCEIFNWMNCFEPEIKWLNATSVLPTGVRYDWSLGYPSHYGGFTPRSLQILRASLSEISECLGTVEIRLVLGFMKIVWLPPSLKKLHLFFFRWAIKRRLFIMRPPSGPL